MSLSWIRLIQSMPPPPPFNLSKIHFNNILPSTPGSSKRFHPSDFSTKKSPMASRAILLNPTLSVVKFQQEANPHNYLLMCFRDRTARYRIHSHLLGYGAEEKTLLFSKTTRLALGPTRSPIQWVPGISSWKSSGRHVKWAPHLHLEPRLWMRGAIPLLSLLSFMIWTGTILPLPLPSCFGSYSDELPGPAANNTKIQYNNTTKGRLTHRILW
jgi:hypothetical protein